LTRLKEAHNSLNWGGYPVFPTRAGGKYVVCAVVQWLGIVPRSRGDFFTTPQVAKGRSLNASMSMRSTQEQSCLERVHRLLTARAVVTL
jgi:hypothetical protein